ncbi:MAG: hypothetical protein ACT4OY_07455 [Alphaproteobacteria bacterium]
MGIIRDFTNSVLVFTGLKQLDEILAEKMTALFKEEACRTGEYHGDIQAEFADSHYARRAPISWDDMPTPEEADILREVRQCISDEDFIRIRLDLFLENRQKRVPDKTKAATLQSQPL